MPKTRPPYPAEFRRRLAEMVHAGQEPKELARKFEPSAQSIQNWVGRGGRYRFGGIEPVALYGFSTGTAGRS